MPRPVEVLRELEQRWRAPLLAVSLVVELDASDDDVRAAVRALGGLYENAWDTEEQNRLLYETFPACMVVALAGMGALDYAHGNYWGGVWEQAGRAPNPNDQGRWGDAFRHGLQRFRLARFEGLPQVNVSEIMMHAGVPGYCLADFLNLLLHRQSASPDLTAHDVLAWATAPGHDSRLSTVDKPVQRFLRFGGEYAEDFVDRSLELLDRLRQPAFDADGLGLPARIIDKARRLTESGMLDLGATRRGEGRPGATAAHPGLVLEPFGRGLIIWLPPVGEAADGRAVWQVQIDGDRHAVPSRSLWPGASETAPATSLPLGRPARRVTACLSGAGHEFEVDVVDPEDPLLVFSEDGRRIPRTAALTPDPVWLMHPASDALDGAEMEFRGSVTELEDVPAPYGWVGWRLRRVDLQQTSALRLGGRRWRLVHGARRSRLELASLLPGVNTVYDTPVFADGPRIVLPTDPGAATSWSVRIRRPGANAALGMYEYTIEHDESIYPWRTLTRPLVGPYEITVRGPLGRGMHRTLEIVEGLRTQSVPPWRRMEPTGLVAASVYATGTVAGLRVEPAQILLTGTEATAQLTVSGPECTEVIRVTPPHMAVQRTAAGERSDWSLRPIRLATESLREGKLLVCLPVALETELIVRHGDTDVQRVSPEATGSQPLARFDLGRIADTVRRHGTASLEIEIETARFPVARCAPRRLAEEVVVDPGGWLRLCGGVAIDGLMVGCYQLYAPWRDPVILPIGPDLRSEPLPDQLRWGGPMAVLLRVEDPWLPLPWPAWPPREDTFSVDDVPWSTEGQNAAEADLSGFLAGKLPPTRHADAVPLAIRAYHRMDDLHRYGVNADVRDCTAKLLADHPTAALAAAVGGELAAAELVAPLIHAGLAALPRRRYLPPEDERRLWNSSPVAALLASAHALAANCSDNDTAELREQLLAVCGGVAGTLLAGQPDPHAHVGAFDAAAEHLARLPAEQVDSIWRAAAVVPRGLLEADERAAAARELFDARDRAGIRRVAAQAGPRLAELTALIGQARGKTALAPIQARGSAGGWLALPALSLALALAARISADGPRWGLLASLVPLHATLARHAPRLVTVDVLLAKLLLCGARA